jgi:hypothetical protein
MRRALLMATVLASTISGCTSGPPPPLRPGDPRLDTHPVLVLLAAEPEFDGYSRALSDGPHPFVCGQGGVREEAWAVCPVGSAGVVVLVPFRANDRPPLVTAEVEFEDPVYGVPVDLPSGFVDQRGQVTVRIMSADQMVGEVSG